MKILDINLLLYAIDARSPHHANARNFLDRILNTDETVALPWTVILGFLNLVTNGRVFPRALTADQALEVIDGWLARPNVVALDPGPDHWSIMRDLLRESGTAGSLVADAHLAALALERGAELCSADADFGRYPRLRWVDPVR
jgi:toxin-antitoxin system PIN domain toxin